MSGFDEYFKLKVMENILKRLRNKKATLTFTKKYIVITFPGSDKPCEVFEMELDFLDVFASTLDYPEFYQ